MRNLDGIYYRVMRNERWTNVCFTDLESHEVEDVLRSKSIEWLQSLYEELCNVLDDVLNVLEQDNISTSYYRDVLADISDYTSTLIKIYLIRSLIRLVANEHDIRRDNEEC